MKKNSLEKFIKENIYFIFEYINKDILKGLACMNQDYFIETIKNILNNQENIELSNYESNPNIFPYFLFTQLGNKGKVDYTSFRVETINMSQLNKESSTYYNYARFSLENNFLNIELMQSKIGGMPIDDDIVKFKKQIPIKFSGLEVFINKNRDC